VNATRSLLHVAGTKRIRRFRKAKVNVLDNKSPATVSFWARFFCASTIYKTAVADRVFPVSYKHVPWKKVSPRAKQQKRFCKANTSI